MFEGLAKILLVEAAPVRRAVSPHLDEMLVSYIGYWRTYEEVIYGSLDVETR